LCCRGWSRRRLDDLEPITGLVVVGIEAESLAKEDGGGFVLVASCGELAQEAICDRALRIESDDVAEIGLSVEVAPERDLGASTHDQERHALGLAFECVVTHRDDPGKVATFEQL
jgi:hypothetical protein